MSRKLCTKSFSGLLNSIWSSKLRISFNQRYTFNKLRTTTSYFNLTQFRWKTGKGRDEFGKVDKSDLSSIVIPVPVTPVNNSDDISVGEELSKKINKGKNE